MADRDYKTADVLDQYRYDGSMIRPKARVLTEDLLDKMYGRIQDPDVSTSTLLDIGKFLMELGDMKPKQAAPPSSQEKFSVTINIPQQHGPPINVTGVMVGDSISGVEVDGDPVIDLPSFAAGVIDESEPPELAAAEVEPDLGPVPFRIPDFSINADLIGPTR